MEIPMETVKRLRDETGVSITQCKKALEEAGGDLEKARAVLRTSAAMIASKKADRALLSGVVEAYTHAGNTVASIVVLSCETDFVARNAEFVRPARDIAMHIAAMNPQDQRELLEQAFIKDSALTVGALLAGATQKFGENVAVTRFARYSVR